MHDISTLKVGDRILCNAADYTLNYIRISEFKPNVKNYEIIVKIIAIRSEGFHGKDDKIVVLIDDEVRSQVEPKLVDFYNYYFDSKYISAWCCKKKSIIRKLEKTKCQECKNYGS